MIVENNPIMSEDENPVQSQTICKLLRTKNKMYTPCRTVGLKRRSTCSPLHTNILKTKVISETTKYTQLNENLITINTEIKEKSIPNLNYITNMKPKNIIDKQREIEELKTQLKNSEQHNLGNIQELSKKWLKVCQDALMSLFNKLNQNQNTNLRTMEDLITHLGIDHNLIHFDCDNQEFFK